MLFMDSKNATLKSRSTSCVPPAHRAEATVLIRSCAFSGTACATVLMRLCAVVGLVCSALLLAVILAGCKVGPDYKRPALDVPGNFRNAPEKPATNSLADLSWYELFPDENLQNLIRIALTNNYDLRIAITRVEQARQAVIEVRSGMLPQIGYGAGVGRGKNVSNGNAAYNKGHTASSYLGEGTAAWEIDLWGRLRRQTESAQAQYLATEE